MLTNTYSLNVTNAEECGHYEGLLESNPPRCIKCNEVVHAKFHCHVCEKMIYIVCSEGCRQYSEPSMRHHLNCDHTKSELVKWIDLHD